VDRIAAEPGSSLKLDRVLLFHDGRELKVGAPAVEGIDVEVKILGHRRGPRIESLRYKSKKRVRVHRGGRADLTAIEIVAVGGITAEREGKAAADHKPATPAKRAAKPRIKAEKKEKAEPVEAAAEAPAKSAPRRSRAARSKEETK
ncbi:MAG TPA: 50S ribosomal protein L21, partial [Candidatus Sulfotelmatobacter sp.]|nr:50S ribosomal protein L21 [Candidatus Sulfotelmatobacter sp.]